MIVISKNLVTNSWSGEEKRQNLKFHVIAT